MAADAGPAADRVFVVAGNTFRPVPGGDGGPATEAAFAYPVSVSGLPDGGFLVVDAGDHRVRRVDRSGFIYPLAGTGREGSDGDGGPASAATLQDPQDAILAADGSILIADFGAHRIRRVASDGTISTFAGTGRRGYSPDGISADQAFLNSPGGLALGPSGTVLMTEGGRVREIGRDGALRTVAGGGATAPAEGAPATEAKLTPFGMAVLPSGELAVSDPASRRVWRVRHDGTLAVLAGNGQETDDYTAPHGDGGPARLALVPDPGALLAEPDGSLLVADGNALRRVTPDGTIVEVAGGHGLSSWGPFAEPMARAPFASFFDMARTSDGGVLIADTRNNRIRFWAPTGGTQRLLIAPTRLERLGEPLDRLKAGFLVSESAQVEVELRLRGGRTLRQSRAAAPGDNRIEVSVPRRQPVCRLRIAARTADGRVATMSRTPFWDRPRWSTGGGPPPQPLRLPPPVYVNYKFGAGERYVELHVAPDGNATFTVWLPRRDHADVRFLRLHSRELQDLRAAVRALRPRDLRDRPDLRTRDGQDHRVALTTGEFSALTFDRYATAVMGARCLTLHDFPLAGARQWRLIRVLKRAVERRVAWVAALRRRQ